MVRIINNNLVIEIDCKNIEPLALLAEMKEGLLNMLEIANVNSSDNGQETISVGIIQTTRLIKQMSITRDQLAHINDDLSGKQIEEFNKW